MFGMSRREHLMNVLGTFFALAEEHILQLVFVCGKMGLQNSSCSQQL